MLPSILRNFLAHLSFVLLAPKIKSDVNKAFLTGEAKYMSTGRGFVIVHEKFLFQYCRYLQSHFVPAFEMLLLLIVSKSVPVPFTLDVCSVPR